MERYTRMRRQEALDRAAYHRFAASRGWIPGGNDPLTGLTWERTFAREGILDPVRAAFARAIHKAHARFWLVRAAEIGGRGGR